MSYSRAIILTAVVTTVFVALTIYLVSGRLVIADALLTSAVIVLFCLPSTVIFRYWDRRNFGQRRFTGYVLSLVLGAGLLCAALLLTEVEPGREMDSGSIIFRHETTTSSPMLFFELVAASLAIVALPTGLLAILTKPPRNR